MATQYNIPAPQELDRFAILLTKYLTDHHFPQEDDEDFIHNRTEDAYDELVKLRLSGMETVDAEDGARKVLFAGLEVSLYDAIVSNMDEFPDVIPEEMYPYVLSDAAQSLAEYFPEESKGMSQEWFDDIEGYYFQCELIGRMAQYLENRFPNYY